jgi:HPt (histidine-containing phosphotransfer) domain-containing protein
MAKAKSEKPTVATYADHEVITPPHKLRGLVAAAEPGDDDPVARAEHALETLSSEFGSWMETECERLELARRGVRKSGLVAGKLRDDLFHAAHDIKGEAATFGFPLAGDAANSLCRLIEHTPELNRVPLDLIDQHVDAIRAIIRENTRPNAEAVAMRLVKRLRDVTEDFLRRENPHRLEEIESILAPPLSPDDAAI